MNQRVLPYSYGDTVYIEAEVVPGNAPMGVLCLRIPGKPDFYLHQNFVRRAVQPEDAPAGRSAEWYVMEVRHRNAVIGVAKQYLIDGEPARALAILRQVQNGIGSPEAAKMPEAEQAESDTIAALTQKLAWYIADVWYGDEYNAEGGAWPAITEQARAKCVERATEWLAAL